MAGCNFNILCNDLTKCSRDVGNTVDASEVLDDGSNHNYNIIDRTELIKTAKYAKIKQSSSGPVVAGGSQGSPGSASERGETAPVHYVRGFLSLGLEAEKIQKQSQAARMIDQKKEKDIKFMNSRRDCAESGGNIRKVLDSGPVGTRSCLVPLRSHVAGFSVQRLQAVVVPCQMRVPIFIT